MEALQLSMTDRQLIAEHTAALNNLARIMVEQRGERLYSNKDAARILGVCQNTIVNWLKNGRITRVSKGCRSGIPQSEIDKLKG